MRVFPDLRLVILLFVLTKAQCFQSVYSLKQSFNLRLSSTVLRNDILKDTMVTALCTGLSAGLLSALTKLAKDGIIDTNLCRKLIHTIAAPAFVLFWPFYSSSGFESRAIASTLAGIQFVRLIRAGYSPPKLATPGTTNSTSIVSSEFNLADAISRSGSRGEAYGGPLIYVVVILVATLAYFR
jgi:hypothetical protein